MHVLIQLLICVIAAGSKVNYTYTTSWDGNYLLPPINARFQVNQMRIPWSYAMVPRVNGAKIYILINLPRQTNDSLLSFPLILSISYLKEWYYYYVSSSSSLLMINRSDKKNIDAIPHGLWNYSYFWESPLCLRPLSQSASSTYVCYKKIEEIQEII
jgi:hypothetical protein